LPLALELAASRVATTGVAEVLVRLPEDLSSSGLAGVVEWSHRLLGEHEQRLLEALSVFGGGFDATAVEGLMSHVPGWTGDVTPALGELVESSLVARHEVGTGPGDGVAGGDRFRLLEMVRTFAASQLAQSDRLEDARRAHAVWVRDVVTAIRSDWSRADGAELSARLARCSTDVATALRWALDTDEIALASEISHAVASCWHWTPGPTLRDLMVDVAERGARHPGPDTAAGVAAGAFIAGELGEVDRAVQLGTTALELSEDPDVRGTAAMTLAVAAMYSGDHAGSVRHFREVAGEPELPGGASASLALPACYPDDLASAREHAALALTAGAAGSDHTLAFARYAAGEVETRTDPERGVELLRQAVEDADRVDAEQVGRVARIALFALLVRAGERDEAAALGLRLVPALRRLGAWNQIWTLARLLAELLAGEGRWSDAAFLLGAADGAPAAPPPVGADIERYAALRAGLAERLSARVLEQIETLGSTTPRTQVLSRAERLLTDL